MENARKRYMASMRKHHSDLQMCVIATSNFHHCICTEAMLPWAYSQSLTELGKDAKDWEMFESSNTQLRPKDSPMAIPNFL